METDTHMDSVKLSEAQQHALRRYTTEEISLIPLSMRERRELICDGNTIVTLPGTGLQLRITVEVLPDTEQTNITEK